MQYYRDYSAVFSRENNGYVNEKQSVVNYWWRQPLF